MNYVKYKEVSIFLSRRNSAQPLSRRSSSRSDSAGSRRRSSSAAAAAAAARDEDELEEAQLRRLERRLAPTESQEQKDYREEFFELLDEVNEFKTQRHFHMKAILFRSRRV